MNEGLQTNIIETANDFYEAFKRCNKEKNFRKENGVEIADVVNIPAIVNGCFACELYFKTLLKRYSKKEHNLYKLFCCLRKKEKELIKTKLGNLIQDSIFQYRKFTFEEILQDIGNAFVDWRYIFEEEHMPGFYGNRINRFIPALHIILANLKEIAESNWSINHK